MAAAKRLGSLMAVAFFVTACDDRDDAYEKAMECLLGDKPLAKYSVYSTPRAGHGRGTLVLASGLTGHQPTGWFVDTQDTWWDRDTTVEERNVAMTGMFDDKGGTSGSCNIQTKSESAIGVVVPSLHRVLTSASGGIDMNKGVTVSISSSNIVDRRVLLGVFEDALPFMKQSVRDSWSRRTVAVGAADYLLENYTVEILVDKTVNPELSATIAANISGVTSAARPMELTVEGSAKNDKQLSLELRASEPVVVAVLWLQKPQSELRTPDDDEDPWVAFDPVSPTREKIKNFESFLDKRAN